MTEKTQNDSKEEKQIIRPFILNAVSTYVSKTFSISLTDEELKFNESCCFRIDFDAFLKKENTSFYLEVDLMFTDYSKFSELTVSQNLSINVNYYQCTDELKLSAFKRIATFKALITNPEQGILSLFLKKSHVFQVFMNTCLFCLNKDIHVWLIYSYILP